MVNSPFHTIINSAMVILCVVSLRRRRGTFASPTDRINISAEGLASAAADMLQVELNPKYSHTLYDIVLLTTEYATYIFCIKDTDRRVIANAWPENSAAIKTKCTTKCVPVQLLDWRPNRALASNRAHKSWPVWCMMLSFNMVRNGFVEIDRFSID